MESSLKILLIEDNPGDAFLIKFYLEESILNHAQIVHAENLKNALDLLKNNFFNIVILDLNLPDSTGIKTLEAVLNVNKEIVTLVLTGLQDEELGIQTVKLGAQDFLVKGQFDGKVFSQAIRYALERANVRKEIMKYTNEIDRIELRLDIVQKLTQAGFWRLIIKNSSIYCSDYFKEIVHTQQNIENYQQFLALFHKSSKSLIQSAIESAIKDNSDLKIKVKLVNENHAILEAKNVFIERIDAQVLIGILKLIEP